MKVRSWIPVVAVAALAVVATALLPSSAGAAAGSTTLTGKLTVTGSQGRDNIVVEFPSGGYIEVTPAATVTGATGVCNPEIDPATGRPTHNLCRVSTNENHEVLVDLRGGNDAAAIAYDPQQSQTAPVNLITGSGGAGNDAVTTRAPVSRVLLGGDGDDALAAPGRTSSSNSVVWDGGPGSDTASFADTSTLFVAGAFTDQPQLHVNASLATKTASLSRPAYSEAGEAEPGLRTVRTDSLTSIEGLIGGRVGDVLTGSAGADTVIGGDGPDNLVGGDGADLLSGEDGLDSLNGGLGADTLDGGVGIDSYAKSADGFNTYLVRDGFLEDIACAKGDIVTADLADKITDPTVCASVSVAQAKHLHDTKVVGRTLRVRDGSVRVRLRCPERKTEDCEGKLAATGRGRSLGATHYRIPRGETKRYALDRAAAPGTAVRVRLTETDSDGLDRKVARTLSTASR